jgi:hypothetical protein
MYTKHTNIASLYRQEKNVICFLYVINFYRAKILVSAILAIKIGCKQFLCIPKKRLTPKYQLNICKTEL